MQNESTGFSESLRGGRARLAALSKLGPVHTPEHPLIKPQSRAKIFLPSRGFRDSNSKPDSKKFYKRIPPRVFYRMKPRLGLEGGAAQWVLLPIQFDITARRRRGVMP